MSLTQWVSQSVSDKVTYWVVSSPLDDLCIDIWISAMIICLSIQIPERQGTAMYYLLSCSGQLTKIIYQFLFGEIQLIFIFNFTVYSKSKDTQPKSPATEICRLHLCVLQACWQCWTVFHHLPLFLYCFLRLTFEHFTSKQFPLFWPSSLEFSAETQAVIFLSQNSYGDKG